jgi:hypothetical protein
MSTHFSSQSDKGSSSSVIKVAILVCSSDKQSTASFIHDSVSTSEVASGLSFLKLEARPSSYEARSSVSFGDRWAPLGKIILKGFPTGKKDL